MKWIGRADYMDSCGIGRRIFHIELFFKECLVKTHHAFRCSGLGSKGIFINMFSF